MSPVYTVTATENSTDRTDCSDSVHSSINDFKLKNFRTLLLAIELHKECKKLSLPSYLKDQLLRSSSSVALNLSEGKGRKSYKDQRRFYDIAFGSIRETQTCLLLAEAPDNLIKLADVTAAHLYKLIKSPK